MSNVKRYDSPVGYENESPDGDLVKYSDYAQLEKDLAAALFAVEQKQLDADERKGLLDANDTLRKDLAASVEVSEGRKRVIDALMVERNTL